MRRWQKVFLVTSALITSILLAITIILPDITRDKAIEQLRNDYNRELKIGEIRINPLNLQVEISDLDLHEEGSEKTFVSFERLQFSLSLRSLIDRALIIDDLILERPFLSLEKRGENNFNFSSFIPSEDERTPQSSEAEDGMHFSFNNLQIKQGTLNFIDSSSKVDFIHQIDNLELAVPFVGNIPYLTERYIQPALSLRVDGAPLVIKGEMKPFDRSVETRINLNLEKIDLPYYSVYLQPFLPFELTDGSLSTHLEILYRVSLDQQPKLKVGGDLSLSRLRLEQQGETLLFLPLLLVNLDWAAPLANEYHFSDLSLYNPQLHIRRGTDGRLNLLKLLPQNQSATAGEAPGSKPGPRLTISTLRLREGEFNFYDETAPRPAPAGISNFNFSLKDIQWPQAVASAWQFGGNWKSGGNFKGKGQLLHTPLTVEGQFAMAQLDLTPANNYIPKDIRLALASAKLDTTLTFNLMQRESLTGKISGTLGLGNLSVTGSNEELLRWESLQFDDLNVDIEPLNISVTEVSLTNYLARIQVQSDGQVNLNQITAAQGEEEETAELAASAPMKLPPLHIDELTLQGGEVSFVDRHLPQIFSTTMYELGGRVSGLTSATGEYASVDLRGALENHSPLTISGKIAPLAGDLDTELKIQFTDINLAPVTPYSGTYLGYSIDKGKLYLDLDYRISKRQVEASNRIFLDQFTFGERVESKDATGLPVRLAVALLKDRQGEIHLALPVSGSSDDPEFGLFSTALTLLKNLLIRAATAPFSLLASMFGGGDEDFSQIDFPVGIASLTPSDQEKLDKLALMLTERPSLQLEISAFVDPENDPEGLRREELKQQVEAAWRKAVKPRTDQAMSDTEYLDNLRQVYSSAKFPKPHNAFGIPKKLPPAEMEKLLLANILVGVEELHALAKKRVAAVQTELVQKHPDLKPRIFLKHTEINQPAKPEKKRARVEFGITID